VGGGGREATSLGLKPFRRGREGEGEGEERAGGEKGRGGDSFLRKVGICQGRYEAVAS
jgi:hypothetical protein